MPNRWTTDTEVKWQRLPSKYHTTIKLFIGLSVTAAADLQQSWPHWIIEHARREFNQLLIRRGHKPSVVYFCYNIVLAVRRSCWCRPFSSRRPHFHIRRDCRSNRFTGNISVPATACNTQYWNNNIISVLITNISDSFCVYIIVVYYNVLQCLRRNFAETNLIERAFRCHTQLSAGLPRITRGPTRKG